VLVAQTVIAETCSCPSSTEIFNKTMKGPAEQTFLTLTLLTFSLMPGFCLKCYNDGDEQIVKCDENLGYRTCFIRYNEKGGITGRGCSTKDKVYYKECETNSYGEGTEKFCYCNFYLCNSSNSFGSNQILLSLIAVIFIIVFNNYIYLRDPIGIQL